MDRNELKAICKQKNIYEYQVANKLGISEPTFIRWLRSPITNELEGKIMDAIDSIISDRDQKEGSPNG